MATLKVRKECLESTVIYELNGFSRKVKLSEATPEQLAHLKERGFDVFEKDEKAVK
jgi:hypothetical protein